MPSWLINGEPGDSVPVQDRGLTYGDGLFETIAVREGVARFLNYHLERLAEGCRRLDIPMPAGGIIESEAADLVSGCDSGVLKILLTRGSGERGYAPPSNPSPLRAVGLIPGTGPAPAATNAGIVVRLCDTPITVNRRLAGLKTLGRLDQVLARAEWDDPGIGEGLMSTEQGEVICGTMTNLFFGRDGELFTPDLSRCGIRGVMRRVVMECSHELGIECGEIDLPTDQLCESSEIFVTNSQIGIRPVLRLQKHPFEIGPITRRLMSAVAAAGVGECAA
jgi:4-amino-4-deoxychorismate lyase